MRHIHGDRSQVSLPADAIVGAVSAPIPLHGFATAAPLAPAAREQGAPCFYLGDQEMMRQPMRSSSWRKGDTNRFTLRDGSMEGDDDDDEVMQHNEVLDRQSLESSVKVAALEEPASELASLVGGHGASADPRARFLGKYGRRVNDDLHPHHHHAQQHQQQQHGVKDFRRSSSDATLGVSSHSSQRCGWLSVQDGQKRRTSREADQVLVSGQVAQHALPHQLAMVDEVVFGRDTDGSSRQQGVVMEVGGPLPPPEQKLESRTHHVDPPAFDGLAAAAAATRRVSRRALPHQLAQVDEVVFGRDTDDSSAGAAVAFGRRRTEVTHAPYMYRPEPGSVPPSSMGGARGSGSARIGPAGLGGGMGAHDDADERFGIRFAPDLRTNGIDRPNEFERAFLKRDAVASFEVSHTEEGKPKFGRRRFRMSLLPSDLGSNWI